MTDTGIKDTVLSEEVDSLLSKRGRIVEGWSGEDRGVEREKWDAVAICGVYGGMTWP